MEKTCAIVVTYNRRELLKECIEALKNSLIIPDIMIIDNNSTDGTAEMIGQIGGVMYYNTGSNIGGAGGFQYGIKKAYELEYEYFWLMDDDVIVKKDALSELIHFYDKHPDSGFLSSMAVWTDGNVCKMNYHLIDNSWQDSKQEILDSAIQIKLATFVSFFTSRNVVEKVGLPIGEYFIWGDDTEWSGRISKHYPCWLVGKSQVIHKMKTNQSTTMEYCKMSDLERIERMFYSFRNDCCTEKREGIKEFTRFIYRMIKILISLIFSAKAYKGRKIKVWFKGLVCGLFFAPKIEYVTKV